MNGRLGFCVAGVLALTILAVGTASFAADLIIAENGQCDYQIVLPDKTMHPKIDRMLADTADIMLEMFKANGITVPVVKEADTEAGKPRIYIGDTIAARAAGIDTSTLPVWSYIIKVSGNNIIIAGRDWTPGGAETDKNPPCSLGTVNGMTDFMREYCGTRFLAPGGLPGIEFLPTPRIAIPDNLDCREEPMLSFNSGGRGTSDITLIGMNFFTNVTSEYSGHTHERAVPSKVYGEEHPEYFALLNGQRQNSGLQLCYSNKDVQELIYKDMIRSLDLGYPVYLSLQADGFRGCQCDECKKLFNTDSWTEKLWQLNKIWAERLEKDRPGKIIEASAYTVTEHPPESFDKFPPNLRVSSRSTEDALQEWSAKLPGGMTTYLHAWGSYHLCGYMPVRTPLYAQDLVKMFAKYNVKGTRLDGAPALMWGMEGPTIYTYARMLDDPEHNSALELIDEYIQAAYGPAAYPMSRFFDELHHTLEIYARVFGVDDGSFQLYARADGRRVRYLTGATKLRLIGFLYPPETLARLESQLTQAERITNLSNKQKLRLALVRREFNYLSSTAHVVHMYNAYLTQKTPETLDQLLTEMEKRRDMILEWYDTERPYRPDHYKRVLYLQLPISPDWNVYIGGQGYYHDHLLANGGSYLASPVVPFTWNIQEMRKAPLLKPKKIEAKRTPVPLSLDSPQWKDRQSAVFGPLSLGGTEPEWPGNVKIAYDMNSLYLLFEGALPENWIGPAATGHDDKRMINYESFTFLVAPDNNPARYFHFSAGMGDTSMYDARQGFIEDSINPLFNQDDLTWNPEWTMKSVTSADKKSLKTLMIIPFQSLGIKIPTVGAEWKVNFSRMHELRPGWPREISIWSSNPGMDTINDREAFGTLIFK